MNRKNIWFNITIVIIVSLIFGFYEYNKLINNKNNIVINQKEYTLTGDTLNFDSIGIGDEEIKNITKKIKDSKNIEVLYLGGNKITSEGFIYLSSLIDNNFKTIDLSNNNSGDNDGIKTFLENNSFKTIDISGNNLTDISFINFVNNKKTTYLSVNRNSIGDDGFRNILKNNNLEYLSIEENHLTDKSIDYLVNDFKKSNLKYLKLKGNDFSKDGIKKLDKIKKEKLFEMLEY